MDRGALHRRLGISRGKKISTSRIRKDLARAKRAGNVRAERQDVQALNFRGEGKRSRKPKRAKARLSRRR